MELEAPHLPVAAHHRILAEKLEDVDAGRCTRLIVTMPPQNGKSTRVRQGVGWMLGRKPDRRFLHVGYAQKFAERNYGRRIQRMVQSKAFRRTFGDRCKIITDSISFLETEAGGSYQAVGVDAPITGFGADGIVIDDPIKGSKEADSEVEREALRDWYGEVIQTRLSPEGFIIIVMTRWREDDLAGWVQKEHPHEGWETVDFPAILPNGKALWPERYSLEWLESKKKTLTTRSWNSLYMQRPVATEGGILKRKWWNDWKGDPPPIEHVIISLDTAFSTKDSADYSAATVWGYFRSKDPSDETKAPKVFDNIILLDAWQDRVDFPDLRVKVKALIKKHDPDTILIEKKASGQSLIQELRRAGIPVVAYTPDRDKTARAYAIQDVFESGCVWAPKGKHFADMVIDQCAAFPTGANDDLVDCTVQALLRFRQSGRVGLDSDPFDEPKAKEPRKRDHSYYA